MGPGVRQVAEAERNRQSVDALIAPSRPRPLRHKLRLAKATQRLGLLGRAIYNLPVNPAAAIPGTSDRRGSATSAK